MATKLDKELTRETSVKVNEREVILTLKEDQTINFKLKGMKSGHVGIGINELYEQLTCGVGSGSEKATTPSATSKVGNGNDVISLHDLRHNFNIPGLPYES